MYEVNGIDLSTVEYRVLKSMYDGEKASDGISIESLQRIRSNLLGRALINGNDTPGLTRYGGISALGKSFIEDYEVEQRAERSKLWSNRHFQLSLSIGTLIGSGIVSFITNLLMGR